MVTAGGTLGNQSGGVSVSQVGTPLILDFGSSQAGRPISVALAPTATDLVGQISAAPCGGASTSNPNGTDCPPNFNDPNHVLVNTADKAGAVKLLPFSISIGQAPAP